MPNYDSQAIPLDAIDIDQPILHHNHLDYPVTGVVCGTAGVNVAWDNFVLSL